MCVTEDLELSYIHCLLLRLAPIQENIEICTIRIPIKGFLIILDNQSALLLNNCAGSSLMRFYTLFYLIFISSGLSVFISKLSPYTHRRFSYQSKNKQIMFFFLYEIYLKSVLLFMTVYIYLIHIKQTLMRTMSETFNLTLLFFPRKLFLEFYRLEQWMICA